jgi:SAM-dependent methyltransferase
MSQSIWDERYSQDGFAFGTEPNDFLSDTADRLPVGDVLCLGEGEGRNAVFLAERGHRVTAVDASSVGLEKTQRLAASRGVEVETVAADLEDYQLGVDRWDGVVSIFCHVPPNLRRRVHGRLAAALRPGGVFVMEAYTPEQLELGTGGPPVAELLYDPTEVFRELEGLELVIARELVREVHEGRYHNGPSAVMQICAVKA